MDPIAEITDVTHDGKTKLPRVLIVDVPGPFLDSMIETQQSEWEKLGVQPLFMPVGINTPAEIAKFARAPENKVDAVVTGNNDKISPGYGIAITKALMDGNTPFKGPVAIQCGGEPAIYEIKRAKESGAIGMFNKGNREEVFSAICEALKGPARSV